MPSTLAKRLKVSPLGRKLPARTDLGLFARADAKLPSLSHSVAGVQRRLAEERAARRIARDRDALFTLAGHYASTKPEFAKDLMATARNEVAG